MEDAALPKIHRLRLHLDEPRATQPRLEFPHAVEAANALMKVAIDLR